MFTDQGGFQVGETAHSQQRAAIPATASLRVDPERIERMWAMRAADRIQAAHEGRFTLGEMLQWASRRPNEVELVDGEFWFITAYLADGGGGAEDDSADRAQRFWDGDHTPLPQRADPSPVDERKASRDTSSSGTR
jgi:hypothetical protein